MRAEGKGECGLAALPGLDEALRVAEEIAEEEEHRTFPGEPRRSGAQERHRPASDVGGEGSERHFGGAAQPGHGLRRKLDREPLRLAVHVAEQGLRLRFARGPVRRPAPRPARELRGGRAEAARQPGVGKSRADRQQVEQQAARGVQRRGAHLLRVDDEAGGEHARRRRQRHEREQQVRTARLDDQLRRTGADGGLRGRLALADADQRLRQQLVHRHQHPRLAQARGDVDAVDLDARARRGRPTR